MSFLTDLDNYVLFGSQYDEKVPFLEDYVLFDRPTGKDSYLFNKHKDENVQNCQDNHGDQCHHNEVNDDIINQFVHGMDP